MALPPPLRFSVLLFVARNAKSALFTEMALNVVHAGATGKMRIEKSVVLNVNVIESLSMERTSVDVTFTVGRVNNDDAAPALTAPLDFPKVPVSPMMLDDELMDFLEGLEEA